MNESCSENRDLDASAKDWLVGCIGGLTPT